MSRNEAAKQFGVGIRTAINWVKRQQETGSVAPGQMGGHRPKAISGEHRQWVLQRTEGGDFTLRGLGAERGLKVDYRSVWEYVHAEKLSFKKSVAAADDAEGHARLDALKKRMEALGWLDGRNVHFDVRLPARPLLRVQLTDYEVRRSGARNPSHLPSALPSHDYDGLRFPIL
jgi:transposase